MSAPFRSVSDKDILAMPAALSDRSVARNLGITVERVEKVRGAAVTTHDGRRKLRPADEPDSGYSFIGKTADALISDQRNTIRLATEGSARLLLAHLAYHKRHNPQSKFPPLAHAGRPKR